jgi:hypothetical protein
MPLVPHGVVSEVARRSAVSSETTDIASVPSQTAAPGGVVADMWSADSWREALLSQEARFRNFDSDQVEQVVPLRDSAGGRQASPRAVTHTLPVQHPDRSTANRPRINFHRQHWFRDLQLLGPGIQSLSPSLAWAGNLWLQRGFVHPRNAFPARQPSPVRWRGMQRFPIPCAWQPTFKVHKRLRMFIVRGKNSKHLSGGRTLPHDMMPQVVQ